MTTPTPSTNTPQKHLAAFSSPVPRSVPMMMNYDSPAVMNLLQEGGIGMGISMSGMGMSSLGLSASAMGRADEDERRRRLENIIATLKTKPGRVGEEGIIALCKKEGLDVEREETPSGEVMLVLVIGSEVMCDVFVKNGEIDSVKLETAIDRERPGFNFGPTGSKILLDSLSPLPGMTRINLTLERFSHNLDKLLRMDKLSAPENGGVNCYQAVFGVYTSLKKLFEHEKKMALTSLEANTPCASQKAEREVLCKKSGRPRINAGTCLGLSLEYWMDRRHLIHKPTSKQPLPAKGKEKIDTDSVLDDDYPEDRDTENNRIYALTIECESSPSSMYSPIRITDSWISDAIKKVPDATSADMDNILTTTPTIDWVDPPATYISSAALGEDDDAMNLDAAPGQLPNIRFVARFNPPLAVPLSVFVSIYQSLGLELPSEIQPTTFVGLALRPGEQDPGLTGFALDSTREIRSEKTVLVVNSEGKEEEKLHANSLYVPKTEYSRAIEALPFHHPKQLIEILPTLRQYAFTTSLLQHTFHETSPTVTPDQAPANEHKTCQSPPLTPKHNPNLTPPLQLDTTLYYAPPAPRLTLHLPHPSSPHPTLPPSPTPSSLLAALLSTTQLTPHHAPLKITLDILPNADLSITDQNMLTLPPPLLKHTNTDTDTDTDTDTMGLGMEMAMVAPEHEHAHAHAHEPQHEKVKRIGRALDVCGDLGVWGEWIRRGVLSRG